MLDLSNLGTFVAVVLGLFLITTGPVVLLVLTRTVHGGHKAGILTGLGASVGLSALLMTSALAFNTVKFVGAAYLVYLGIRALREKDGHAYADGTGRIRFKGVFLGDSGRSAESQDRALFLAFLPQFVHPNTAPRSCNSPRSG
ncbi:MAG: Transporter, LysE family [uncultured Paraburkholderia sp.]|nr:MAG: Transporter, LysE family [uncultured Paraburkholderia sp.]